jgi:hypothetical protein
VTALLLRQPGGFESFGGIRIGVDMNDLSLSKRPDVGHGALNLDSGVSRPVDRDKTLTESPAPSIGGIAESSDNHPPGSHVGP